MNPIKFVDDSELLELSNDEFVNTLGEICDKLRKEKRALAFAFLLYDFKDAQIAKIIDDKHYCKALDSISGKYLSIFYVNSEYKKELKISPNESVTERRDMNSVNSSIEFNLLKTYLKFESDIKIPSLLFFQIDSENNLTDSFIIELEKDRIEDSFSEIKGFIETAVDTLKRIKSEYYSESDNIFNLVKKSVESRYTKLKVVKVLSSVPMRILGRILTKIV